MSLADALLADLEDDDDEDDQDLIKKEDLPTDSSAVNFFVNQIAAGSGKSKFIHKICQISVF